MIFETANIGILIEPQSKNHHWGKKQTIYTYFIYDIVHNASFVRDFDSIVCRHGKEFIIVAILV